MEVHFSLEQPRYAKALLKLIGTNSSKEKCFSGWSGKRAGSGLAFANRIGGAIEVLRIWHGAQET